MGTSPVQSPSEFPESQLAAIEDLLHQIIRHGRFELKFVVKKQPSADGPDKPAYLVDFSGADADLLLERNGALLDALESVVLRAVRLEDDLFGKITFDCRDWRRLRVEELKLMAQVAAERVIETGDPFSLSPMSARDRRIVHLALKDQSRVRTESEGTGVERRVVILPASKR